MKKLTIVGIPIRVSVNGKIPYNDGTVAGNLCHK